MRNEQLIQKCRIPGQGWPTTRHANAKSNPLLRLSCLFTGRAALAIRPLFTECRAARSQRGSAAARVWLRAEAAICQRRWGAGGGSPVSLSKQMAKLPATNQLTVRRRRRLLAHRLPRADSMSTFRRARRASRPRICPVRPIRKDLWTLGKRWPRAKKVDAALWP